MSYTPGLHNAPGRTIREPYINEEQSVTRACAYIWEGAIDAELQGKAGRIVRDAGARTVQQRAQAILSAFWKETNYAPDPPGREMIKSARATWCLRDSFCIPIGDCDDAIVAVGAALMSIGIPVLVVKHDYSPEQQQHVLLAAEDERGRWLYVDPSDRGSTVSYSPRVRPAREDRYDPMNGKKPESIGVGRVVLNRGGELWEKNDAGWWRRDAGEWKLVGTGALPPRVGVGVWPCTVDELLKLKQYLAGPWSGLYKDFNGGCSAITDAQRTAFNVDYSAMRVWATKFNPVCFASDEVAAGQDYVNKMVKWYGVLNDAGCKPSYPQPDPPSVTPPPAGSSDWLDKLTKAAGVIGIVAGVGAGIYFLAPLIKAGVDRAATGVRSRSTARSRRRR